MALVRAEAGFARPLWFVLSARPRTTLYSQFGVRRPERESRYNLLRLPMKKLIGILAIIACIPIPSFAWGPEGHRIVAEIARRHLSAAARRQVRELLGNDDLAAISTWADEVRSQRPETYGWHFVDIPWNAGGFSQARDCFHIDEKHPAANNDHHNCVVDRIEIFERALADHKAPIEQRREALKFVVHLVGDIHQPLHAVGEARGGNDIHVIFFGSVDCGGRPCNLHWVWDEGLIQHAHRPEAGDVSYLEQSILRGNWTARAGGTSEDWANESFRIAHEVWLANGGRADDAYFRKSIEIVDERLAIAGLRLARVLNGALK